MSRHDEQHCRYADERHICNGSFTKTNKVRDHCHKTGSARGAAHTKCIFSLTDMYQ